MHAPIYLGRLNFCESLYRLSSCLNEASKQVTEASKKIISDISAIKKTTQLALKIFEMHDLCTKSNLLQMPASLLMKEFGECCAFYDAYKNISYWKKLPKDPRPLLQYLYTACFTFTDCGNSLLYLKKWSRIVPKLTTAVAEKDLLPCPFILSALIDRSIQKQIATLGLFFLFVELSQKTINAHRAYLLADSPQKKELAHHKWRSSVVKVATAGINLFLMLSSHFLPSSRSFATRFFLTSLAISSKSMALYSFFVCKLTKNK